MAREIRPLARADISAMAAIYGGAVETMTATFETEPPDVAEMTRRFEAREAGGYPGFAAVADGAVLGYAETRAYHHRHGYRFTIEDSIFLAPEARGQGTGTALLGELVAAAGARRLPPVIALVGHAENHRS